MGKKRKRSGQHLTDIDDFPNKHKPACLNAHHSTYSEGNTCSYRWQGYLKAQSDSGLYTWSKNHGIQPPTGQNWNVGHPGNFQDKSTVPYWHESHHIIPHAELLNGITKVGGDSPKAGEITLMIRGGLLDEGYNLNDQINMIILPMLSLHARVAGLPKHRMTPTTFHHSAYSKIALEEIKRIFQPMKKAASKEPHEMPDYAQSKAELEQLSQDLYQQIKSAGQLMKKGGMAGDALEDITKDHLLANR